MKRLVLRGTVVRGQGLGRRLGFPTANLKTSSRLPPRGVYKVLADGAGLRGRVAACNVGYRPTVRGRGLCVEVHIPGFKGRLYGKRLSLTFLQRLRGETRFKSLAALKAQIRRDVDRVKAGQMRVQEIQ